MEAGCVFCAIVEGAEPARVVDENGGALAFLDINPATEGHTLVVPRNHVRDIWDLTSVDSAAVWALARVVARKLRTTLRPDGMTLLQSNGIAAWQHVSHFHVHVVPRWAGDGLSRPWAMVPADAADLDRVAERLHRGG